MASAQLSVPMNYYRGGTSKAMFLHEKDIPPPGSERDRLLIRLMGSPDPMQIDGLGGSHIVTSKIAVLKPSSRSDADVDYLFCQVTVNADEIDYHGNCGNISAAVGPFAITEGLIKNKVAGSSIDPKVKTQKIRIFNTGTGKILTQHVPIDDDGHVVSSGSFSIDGCPGTGAPILIDMKDTIGGACNKGILPTGHATDTTTVGDKDVQFTVCDVGNIVVFGYASDFGIQGNETAEALTNNATLIAKLKEFRGKAAMEVGMCQHWEKVDEESGVLPMVALVSKPTNDQADIQSRLFLDNKCHTAMAGTGSVCHAACSRVPGSVVNQCMKAGCEKKPSFNIQHPSGSIPVAVDTKPMKSGQLPEFESLSFVRTARRILRGEIDVPDNVKDDYIAGMKKLETDEHVNGVEDKPSTNGATQASETKAFAQFVSTFEPNQITPAVIEKLQILLLDHIGVASNATINADSTPAFLSTLKGLSKRESGPCTIIGQGSGFEPSTAALFNGAFAHSLDFDDTYAPGALHPGVTVLSATFAAAQAMPDAPSDDVLCALAVGYETAARLARAIGTGGYAAGFHNTATCGIFGATAAVCRLYKLDATITENAFGLALSKAAGTMQYLENGSWNKRLHAGFAARDALLCVSFAQAGVIGASKAIEGQYGLLTMFAQNADKKALQVADLGQRWEFLVTAIKPYPACRMTHGQIQMAAQVGEKNRDKQVKEIVVSLSQPCFGVVGAPHENKIHPETVVDAQFSSYYQTAVAYIYGDGVGWDAYSHRQDKSVIDLCSKIQVKIDPELQSIQSSIEVQWTDGTKVKETCLYPKGEDQQPLTWQDIQKKFDGLSQPVYGKEVSNEIVQIVKGLETIKINQLMGVIGKSKQ